MSKMSNESVWYIDYASAERASQNSDYIMEGGAYIGKLTRCVRKKSKAGAIGFEFSFKSDDGAKANYMTIWTRSKENAPIQFGVDRINALGALLNLPDLRIVEVEKDESGNPVYGFSEVCGKPIGVVLRKEWYTKSNGEDGWKFDIVHFIDATTKQTYTEKKARREAKTYMAEMRDRIPDAPKQTLANPMSHNNDDLPF